MKEFLTKYWIVILLAGNIFQQYYLLSFLGNYFFYGALVIGILLLVPHISDLFAQDYISRYSFIYCFIFVLIGYQLTFGWFYIWPKTITYVISKCVICLLMVYVLSKNSKFYEYDFFKYIPFVTALLLIGGYFTYNVVIAGRNSLGFTNPNSTGAIAAVSFGIMFIYGGKHKLDLLVTLICLLGVLLSGSRTAMGIAVIAVIIKFGFNKKLIFSGLAILFLAFIALPELNIQFSGIDRFTQAIISNDISSGREDEREGALIMIRNSPLVGNGIYSGQTREAMEVTNLGSHNGYLDFFKWYGIPIGLFLILFLVLKVISLYCTFYNSENKTDRVLLFVVIAVMLATNYEEYIIGVNQMITTMFFVAISILQNKQYEIKNNLIDYNTIESIPDD